MKKFGTRKNDSYIPGGKAAIRNEGIRTQLDWIKRQLEYYSFSEEYQVQYELKRGEIYEFDFGLNVNNEFSNRHFGVVLVDSDANNPLVTICPLKTNHNGAHPMSDLDLGFIKVLRTGKPTLAVINQIRTIDKLRLYLRRAIGCTREELSDRKYEEEYNINRLEEDKLNSILRAYKNYLDGKPLLQ